MTRELFLKNLSVIYDKIQLFLLSICALLVNQEKNIQKTNLLFTATSNLLFSNTHSMTSMGESDRKSIYRFKLIAGHMTDNQQICQRKITVDANWLVDNLLDFFFVFNVLKTNLRSRLGQSFLVFYSFGHMNDKSQTVLRSINPLTQQTFRSIH